VQGHFFAAAKCDKKGEIAEKLQIQEKRKNTFTIKNRQKDGEERSGLRGSTTYDLLTGWLSILTRSLVHP